MIRKLLYLLLGSIILFLFCQKPQTGLDQLFPGPGFEKGWSWFKMPVHYNPNNLYEYIDGEAELYLSYGFKELATLTYFWGSVDDTSFVVDIYDMGTPLSAFGVYSNYRHPNYHYEKIGTEAVVSDFGIKFYQGRYLVELKAGVLSDKIKKAMLTVAQKISKRIKEPAEPPPILTLLPRTNQIDKTLRYVSKNMLNQAFLPGGLEARYRIKRKEITGFIVFFENSGAAKIGFEKLRDFFKKSNKAIFHLNKLCKYNFGVKTLYHGYFLASLNGRFIIGTEDASASATGIELVRIIRENITKR